MDVVRKKLARAIFGADYAFRKRLQERAKRVSFHLTKMNKRWAGKTLSEEDRKQLEVLLARADRIRSVIDRHGSLYDMVYLVWYS